MSAITKGHLDAVGRAYELACKPEPPKKCCQTILRDISGHSKREYIEEAIEPVEFVVM